MSKGNMFLGYARGKVGDAVFYRAMGQQRTRAYNNAPRDPKTRAQMTQRTQLNNLVALYRAMITLLNHSFTNKEEKQSSYNRFVSKNLNVVKVYTPKEMTDAGGAVVAPYRISDGALPAIQVSGKGVNSVTNIAVGSLTIDGNTTVGEFSQALIDNNVTIESGMQFSYVSVVQSSNVQTGYPIAEMSLFEVVIDPTSTAILRDTLPDYGVVVVDGFLGHGEKVAEGGFAYILSKKDANGKLIASPQSLILTTDTLWLQYSSNDALTRALDSYNAQNSPFLVPGSDGAEGSSPSPTNASVASVTLGGTSIVEGGSFEENVFGDPTSVAITGSYLSDVQAVQVVTTLKSGTVATRDVAITAQTDTSITGSYQGFDGGGQMSRIQILMDGNSVFNVALI